MLCNAGESKSIFVDVQNPCLQPPSLRLGLVYGEVYALKVTSFYGEVYALKVTSL